MEKLTVRIAATDHGEGKCILFGIGWTQNPLVSVVPVYGLVDSKERTQSQRPLRVLPMTDEDSLQRTANHIVLRESLRQAIGK